ncbi:MAG: hypothetical protein ACPG7F_05560 [Aggregatilineales bacterium]
MIVEKEVFVDGEYRVGRYTVVILRRSGDNWYPAMMHLDAVITNYRLMLRPFRKKYEPATLPSSYISRIEISKRGMHHCVSLQLATEHELNLMLSTGHIEDLASDLRLMKIPRRSHYDFDDSIARRDIQRLISFFGKEPLLDTSA